MSTGLRRSISWMGATALAFGGINLSIYTMGPLIGQYGTAIIPLFILALLLTAISNMGYLELVLMYPDKSGGITVACTDAFRAYSPILTPILGVGYWFAWLLAASFAALYAAQIIQHNLPWVSINCLSAFLIAVVALLNLGGLSWVSRFAIPLAAAAAFLALLAVFIPVLTGQVVWEHMLHFSLVFPLSNEFGKLSSLMAGFYFIGWIVPGSESVFCFVGDMNKPEENLPRALYIIIGLAVLFYGVCPLIWLGVIGPEVIGHDFIQILSPIFAPLFGDYASVAVLWFILFNMFICLFAPLSGPPRTLAQLSKDGLLPEFLSATSRFGVPWIALLITAATSIFIIFLGAPVWLIAASSFLYLLSIALASVALWLLRQNQPLALRPYRAPTVFIYLGLCSAFIWICATVLGFRQYGLTGMISGICISFIGIPFYLWRKTSDRMKKGLPVFSSSLHFKLTGLLFCVLVLDAIGYVIAVHSINSSQTETISILEDIFILVALLTLTLGLIIPGRVVHAAEEINEATKRIVHTHLKELSAAMKALGSGQINPVTVQSEIIPISILTHDEFGEMAVNFNHMQDEIRKTGLSMSEVQSQLLEAMSELAQLNRVLEDKVLERSKKLDEARQKAQEVTRIKSQFISIVSHELRTPMTIISASLELVLSRLKEKQMGSVTYHLIGQTHQNTKKILSLITDVLNEEKMAVGKRALNLKNQMLSPLIDQAIESTALFAQKYNVTLQLNETIPDAYANIDEIHLQEAFDTVLSNACRLSMPNTQVLIQVQHDQGKIRVVIKSTSQGLSSDFAQKIFSPFTQKILSDTQSESVLSLSNAKSIIEQHHGVIHFETSGFVSLFIIELPEGNAPPHCH